MKSLTFLLLLILIGCSRAMLISGNSGTFEDTRDNHSYKTVKIGKQGFFCPLHTRLIADSHL
jgi:hypothetical protein